MEGGILRFGVAPASWDASTRDRLDAFATALAAASGMEIATFASSDYRAAADAIDQAQLDVAWLPPVVALRGVSRGTLVPLALPVRNGSSTFSAVLFTHRDAPFRNAHDLYQCRAAWVDSQSAAGYIVIRSKMRLEGVDLGTAFADETFAGSHPRVVHAVLSCQADVGATWARLGPDGTVLASAWLEGESPEPARILLAAGPIPADVVAMSLRTPAAIGRMIQTALVQSPPTSALGLAARALFQCESFEVPRREHLQPLATLFEGVSEARRFTSAFPGSRGPI